MRRRTVLGLAAASALPAGAALDPPADRDARALVAGSLQALAGRVPGAAVEAHGSVAARRLVVEDARDPDALALADPILLDGVARAYWLFATNALVVAYRPDADTRFGDDWRAALRRARWGRTDPERDPLGYRTLLAIELDSELDRSVLDGSTVLPETSLARTLEAGGVDAAVVYRNMAVEHGLPYATLPDRVDLSNPALADHYRTATVTVDGRTVTGAPIRYAAAALTDAGREWTRRLVTGRDRLRDAGFTVPDDYPRRVA